MAIPRDPDTLRVPAFMRKRNLRTRARKPLLLTALDRKNAGVVLPELMKPKSRAKNYAFADADLTRAKPISSQVFSWPMLPFEERPAPRRARTHPAESAPLRRKIASPKSSPFDKLGVTQTYNDTSQQMPTAHNYFAEPLIGAPEPVSPAAKKTRPKLRQSYGGSALAKPKRTPLRFVRAHHDTIIGEITHYFGKIQVGVIKLKATLSVGDCIRYETPEGAYEQIVESMEIDRNPVFTARKGDDVGIKLRQTARVGGAVVKV